MFEYIELFNGAIRGRILFLILNLVFIAHFIFFWYKNYRRYGWKMDFWTLITGRYFFVHILFMFPFNGSVYNIYSLGRHELKSLEPFLEVAYLISIAGYFSIYIGRSLFNRKKNHKFLNSIFNPIALSIERNIKNKASIVVLTLISLFLISIVIYFQFKTGNILSPRDFFQGNGAWRPVYNLSLTLFPLVILFKGLRAMQNVNPFKILSIILLVGLSVFLGTRMATLEPLFLLFFFYCIKYNNRIKLKRIALISVLFIYSTILVLSLRSNEVKQHYSDNSANAILYGNTFSDTRDFAYILSKWDNNLLYGKTYSAGLISFIPRKFSPHREKWALGMFTSRLTNYDSKTFPGFRPGFFGEAYFNFGLFGVIILGIITGYLLRFIDLKIKESVYVNNDIIKSYSHITPWFVIAALSISIGFTALYIYLSIMMLLWIYRHFLAFINTIIASNELSSYSSNPS